MSQQDRNGDTRQFDKPRRVSGADKAHRVKKRKQQLFTRTFLYAMLVITVSILCLLYTSDAADD